MTPPSGARPHAGTPRRPSAHAVADRAVNAFERIVLDAGWIFRRQPEADYGIDGEIEAAIDGRAMGILAKVQVKGTKTATWSNGRTSVVVKSSTLNAWASIQLPVILVLHVEDEDAVYWLSPAANRLPKGETTRLRFERTQQLDKQLAGLAQSIVSWYSGFGEQVVQEVPAFGRIFARLAEVAEFDPFTPVNPETDDELRLFYRHLHRLVAYTQVRGAELPPLSWWYACDNIVWPEEDELHYWTLRYLLAYVTPIYQLARDAVRAQLADSPARYFEREIAATADFLESDVMLTVGLDSQAALAEFRAAVDRAEAGA